MTKKIKLEKQERYHDYILRKYREMDKEEKNE